MFFPLFGRIAMPVQYVLPSIKRSHSNFFAIRMTVLSETLLSFAVLRILNLLMTRSDRFFRGAQGLIACHDIALPLWLFYLLCLTATPILVIFASDD